MSSQCKEMAQDAVVKLQQATAAGQRQVQFGNVPEAIRAFYAAARNLGRLTGLNTSCKLGISLMDVGALIDGVDSLRDGIVTTCTKGHAASLSDFDPYEAYRKLRKPLPRQRSKPIGTKKGKKGYKRDKRTWRED